ncbi:serine/threonine-protein kinase DCLK2-like [Actinia tenebrosa]|uniref:non-specific serine/threonine protein kinase n=1 Tax=Actinia tenebrosa TaxID=6105 RepID=A0A6P8HZF4_ACTTE|nr:serine/threonine-protein kinase DCLK2-like [Actinia tenebrosa]
MMTAVRHTSKYSTNEQDMKKDSKIVTFYKNGDIYFSGYVVTITPRRYRSFEVLLSELSRITNLPQGVRYLLDRESGTRIEAIEQLQDGKAYVCASNSKLKRLDYGKKSGVLPQWGSKNKIELPALTNPPKVQGNQTSSRYVPLAHTRHAGTREHKQEATRNYQRVSYKARNVTVIRNGHKPRMSTRVLLSKRTAHSVNQFLDMVNDSLGVTGASNVRKIYTSRGKQVYEVSDLFLDETGIFIAVGNERFRVDDIENILSDDKGTPGNNKRRVKSLGKVSNTGMKHEEENKRTSKEHDDKPTEQDNKKSSLPVLPDLEVKKNKNNYEIRSKVADGGDNYSSIHQKPQSPRHKKTVSKQNSSTRENKNVEQRTDVNSNNVKLPQIGTGHNLVTSQEPQQATTTKGKTDNQDSPRGVGEEKEKLKESVEKEKIEKYPEQKVKKRPSKEFTHHEIEVEYSRVTDKKVEDVYDIGRKIGDGNFAIVRQCTNKTNKKEFALKIIDKKKIKGKEKMIDDEIAIMRKCRHPNIVRLFEDYDTPTDIYLVMELIKGGDLFDAISSSVKFTENVAKTYFRDMCKALAYLHKQRVVHRDMKPENLLVHERANGQAILKLADFGLAVEVKAPLFTVCGTPTYVAPEILEEEGYGLKIDMWAAGVITYIMLCGFPPFRSAKRDQDELFDLIQAGDYEFLSPYWDPISEDAKDLISHLLVVEPHKRYSAEKALTHKWVRLRSPTVGDLSKNLLGEDGVGKKSKKKFKAAALAIQGAQRFGNLADEFRTHRGEKFISLL